jgi:ketosteroid isomerase-like protein
MPDHTPTDAIQIRELIEDRAKALRRKDAAHFLSHHAADLVKFDLAPPLRASGAKALDRQKLEAWMASWEGPIGYELSELEVTAASDLALCHALLRISGVKTDGARHDIWARQTLGLRKREGSWKVTHEHISVPFYMDGSIRAAIDLEP